MIAIDTARYYAIDIIDIAILADITLHYWCQIFSSLRWCFHCCHYFRHWLLIGHAISIIDTLLPYWFTFDIFIIATFARLIIHTIFSWLSPLLTLRHCHSRCHYCHWFSFSSFFIDIIIDIEMLSAIDYCWYCHYAILRQISFQHYAIISLLLSYIIDISLWYFHWILAIDITIE
jgi:hypothetical protein